jgi:hypothetical protein
VRRPGDRRTGEADLERVAALTPDLVLHAGDHQEIPVERLDATAPTVTHPRAPTGLLEPVRRPGGLLGREEQAARVEQDLRDAVAAQRDAVGLVGRRVAVVDLGDYEPGPAPTSSDRARTRPSSPNCSVQPSSPRRWTGRNAEPAGGGDHRVGGGGSGPSGPGGPAGQRG